MCITLQELQLGVGSIRSTSWWKVWWLKVARGLYHCRLCGGWNKAPRRAAYQGIWQYRLWRFKPGHVHLVLNFSKLVVRLSGHLEFIYQNAKNIVIVWSILLDLIFFFFFEHSNLFLNLAMASFWPLSRLKS